MKQEKTSPKVPRADLDSLFRVFTVPENENTTLGKIDQQISQNLMGFLKSHIVAEDRAASDLEKDFLDTTIPDDPIFVTEQAEFLIKKVVAQSVHTSSPNFVGHMTSSLPYFMLPLAKIMIALNQNLVKIETSKAFTPLERQVLGMLHRLLFNRDEAFYMTKTQSPNCALGAFCSDGTIANLTAMWVAINRTLAPTETFDGVNQEGLYAGLKDYRFEGIAILVSERGHYSLNKAAKILGIGERNLISIETDYNNRINLKALKAKVVELQKRNIAIASIVGIAGTTETGHIDPLEELGNFCKQNNIHYHVDAAWGGPTLLSSKYRYLMKGIELADSVTIDAHKQLYVPIGAGMVIFRDETHLNLIEHSAEYVIRSGSRDLGRRTLEGSRPGMAMLVHSGLRIIGRKGYELLIDMGIEKAKEFASIVQNDPDFELITEPELNLFTYRYVPEKLRQAISKATGTDEIEWINHKINKITIGIQKTQRESGKSFASRTALLRPDHPRQKINVFRVVLANPLTTIEILQEMLEEQRSIGSKIVVTD